MEKKMKVLQVGLSFNPGGIESFVMTYYRELSRQGVRFDFISMFPHLAYEEEITSLGGKVFHTCDARKHPLRFSRQMRKILRIGRYNAVHVNMLSAANIVPLIVARYGKVPVVIAHSHNSSTPGLLRNLMHKINRPLIPLFATEYFACSELAGEWLFSEKIRKSENYHVVHNALNLEKFAFRQSERNEVRQELGVEGKFVLGHVGRFEEQKNHEFLLKIFREVVSDCEEAVLLLVGEGELQEEIRKKAKEYRIEAWIQFLGIRKDVARLWKGMDVFVFPSLFEGLPIVALEAQASGIRSVMADTITSEVKLIDKVEFLSLQDSPKKWSQTILSYKGEERKGEENAVIRQAFAKAGYDIETAAQTLLSYYK